MSRYEGGDSPLEVLLALRRPDGRTEVLPRQELLLFTPYHPSPEHPYGCPCSTALPFVGVAAEKSITSPGRRTGKRAGNVRFAVVYKPGEEALDHRRVQARSQLLAQRWAEAMESTRSGAVRDFVAVGMWRSRSLARSAPSPTARRRCG